MKILPFIVIGAIVLWMLHNKRRSADSGGFIGRTPIVVDTTTGGDSFGGGQQTISAGVSQPNPSALGEFSNCEHLQLQYPVASYPPPFSLTPSIGAMGSRRSL